MKHLDLAVGMDFYMTPSLAMCDYVLPAASFIERPHLMIFWGVTNSTMAWKQPMEPLYERKDDYYLWSELARRTNTIGEWPETLEGMYDLFLHKTEFTHSELASRDAYWLFPTDMMYHRYEKYGFGTPSGKAELVPSAFKAAGIDPLPHYVEKSQSIYSTPELAEEYPYSLISGCRVRPYWHTSLRQLKTLRWMHPYPLVEMHPVVARRHNIADGEWVYIETPLGRVKQVAKIMPGMQEDMINAEGYWYYPEKPEEEPYLLGVWDSNINAIISDEYEDCDFAGDNPFRACLCKIYKADTITNYDVPVAAKTLTASSGVAEVDLSEDNKPTFSH
jgi:anaerobic selenocysteine-containing dehydrogenase